MNCKTLPVGTTSFRSSEFNAVPQSQGSDQDFGGLFANPEAALEGTALPSAGDGAAETVPDSQLGDGAFETPGELYPIRFPEEACLQ